MLVGSPHPRVGLSPDLPMTDLARAAQGLISAAVKATPIMVNAS
jgi:hypothetical protein